MTLSQKTPPSENITKKELLAAKNSTQSFCSAFKNYFLYPPGHAYSKNSLIKLKNDLDIFLHEFETLRLDVKRNGFYYKGEHVFSGDSVDSNPAYLLTRDTILFLEFSAGIELDEITLLFDILDKHRKPAEEVDGDIATSLWHFSFKHIDYEAADIFALEAIEFEFSMFQAVPEQKDNNNKTHVNDVSTNDQEHPEPNPANLLEIANSVDLSRLSREEQEALQSMIIQEENREISADVIDILLILLTLESDKIEFSTLLDFIEFEYFAALKKTNFHLAFKICKNVHNIIKVIEPKKPWAVPLVNLFFSALAKEDRLASLQWIEDYNGYISPEKIKYIFPVFKLLPPEIIFTLSQLAARTPIDYLSTRNKIIEVISSKAKHAPQLFSTLLANVDEKTTLILLPVIEEMPDGVATSIYLTMTKHPSPTVRRIGLDGYLKKTNLSGTGELLHLLSDDDAQVKNRMVDYLEQIGGRSAEKLLITFLGKEGASMEDDYHILHCYKVLSECLSEKSVSFLREILLESKLSKIFSNMNTIHKHGAAFALKNFGTEEAMEILNTGAQSARPDVRKVCQKYLEQQ
jgi:hypothetical protein